MKVSDNPPPFYCCNFQSRPLERLHFSLEFLPGKRSKIDCFFPFESNHCFYENSKEHTKRKKIKWRRKFLAIINCAIIFFPQNLFRLFFSLTDGTVFLPFFISWNIKSVWTFFFLCAIYFKLQTNSFLPSFFIEQVCEKQGYENVRKTLSLKMWDMWNIGGRWEGVGGVFESSPPSKLSNEEEEPQRKRFVMFVCSLLLKI